MVSTISNQTLNVLESIEDPIMKHPSQAYIRWDDEESVAREPRARKKKKKKT